MSSLSRSICEDSARRTRLRRLSLFLVGMTTLTLGFRSGISPCPDSTHSAGPAWSHFKQKAAAPLDVVR